MSCLAEQAKILMDEAKENNLGDKAMNERWARWSTCGLCEQDYLGVVRCALGGRAGRRAMGRPETDGETLAHCKCGNGRTMQTTTRTR